MSGEADNGQALALPALDALSIRLGTLFRSRNLGLYLVGGSVRDRLLGRPTDDLDFTSNALPDQTRALLEEAGPDAIFGVGEKFGTIGARFGPLKVEVTTYRTEQYADGSRKPAVQYGSSILEDLSRRDFTINAIAEDPIAGTVIDPFGGHADLRVGVIRAVGNPDERFEEDPLRLLRAVRFVAQLGFVLEPTTYEAIRRTAPSLARISRERILGEMNRILAAPGVAHGIRLLVELGLAATFIPDILALQQTTQGHRSKDVFEHTLRVLERTPPDLVLRWGALLHDIGKPRTFTQENGEIHFPGHEYVGEQLTRDILLRLRADRSLIDRVGRLVGMHMRANQYESEWTDGAVRRLMRDAGPDLPRLLELSSADVTSYRPARIEAALGRVRRLRSRIEGLEQEASLESLKSPLDGTELMALFQRGPGRWIAEVKNYLLEMVLDGKLASTDKEAAIVLARQYVKERLAA